MNTNHILAALVLTMSAGTGFAQKAGGSTAPAPDVTTIDQAKAIASGVASGDAPGFPISISAPGSYRLTSNLVVPAGVDAIQVYASNVTIDLNGFSITGPGYCSGAPAAVTCAGSSNRGISSTASNIHRLTVLNGMIGGFGFCLEARYVARVSGVSMHDCATALIAFDGTIVSQASIHRSAQAGSLYGAAVDGLQMHQVRYGPVTSASVLRGISMVNVYQAFSLDGGTNSALSQSVINATVLGSGVQSVGGNLCNGVAC